MRKKGKKVIRPAGDELMDYLNRGFAICNRCGAVMDRREDPSTDSATAATIRSITTAPCSLSANGAWR